jgi:hypothetical protein
MDLFENIVGGKSKAKPRAVKGKGKGKKRGGADTAAVEAALSQFQAVMTKALEDLKNATTQPVVTEPTPINDSENQERPPNPEGQSSASYPGLDEQAGGKRRARPKSKSKARK